MLRSKTCPSHHQTMSKSSYGLTQHTNGFNSHGWTPVTAQGRPTSAPSVHSSVASGSAASVATSQVGGGPELCSGVLLFEQSCVRSCFWCFFREELGSHAISYFVSPVNWTCCHTWMIETTRIMSLSHKTCRYVFVGVTKRKQAYWFVYVKWPGEKPRRNGVFRRFGVLQASKHPLSMS